MGGHLVGDDEVHTTCEVVLGVARGGATFSREPDAATGYDELAVSQCDAREGGGGEKGQSGAQEHKESGRKRRWWWPF